MSEQEYERLREAAQNIIDSHPAFRQKHIAALKEILDDIEDKTSDGTDKEDATDA